MADVSPNVWQQIKAFLQQYPSVGVVFLIVPLLPVLSNVLSDDDPIGPILWSLIIVIALPALFNVVRAVIDSLQVEKRLRQALVWCFGFCFGVLMLAGTASLCMMLYFYTAPGTLDQRAAAPITEDERTAPTAPAAGTRLIATLFDETTQTVEMPPQRTELQLPDQDSADAPPLTDPVPDTVPDPAPDATANDAYDRCIQDNFAAGDADGILSCTALLEG
ncbi:MAG: hypothetical protein AAGL96_02425 [Pseudomonadota bacterium]